MKYKMTIGLNINYGEKMVFSKWVVAMETCQLDEIKKYLKLIDYHQVLNVEFN